MSVKKYEIGDTIIDCKPLVHTIVNNKKRKVCDNCFVSITGQQQMIYECSGCHHMFYCSADCLTLDRRCHQLECHIYEPYYSPYLEEYMLRLMLRLYLMVINDKDMSLQDKCYEIYNGKVRRFNDMETHLDLISRDNNRMKIFDYLCDNFVYYAKEFSFILSRNLLFTLYCRYLINHFKIIDHKVNSCEIIGSGLYMKASVLNHSCRPNSAVTYCGSRLILKAIEKIAIGEDITINYCDLEVRVEMRNKHLLKYLYFECFCPKCLSGDQYIDFDVFNKIKYLLKQESRQELPNWLVLNVLTDIFIKLYHQIYNKYHPNLITTLIIILSHKLRNKCENIKHLNDCISETRHRIELIFGTKHAIYRQFIECLEEKHVFHL
ncbi:histone-lysine N-methyltransferase SMYD3-like [Oppia nitens]|uniref:histone-lysine N-methyltransferase SMYD3-like n=1 Tax=Oppia nitens TaxID=1686743 RepID=UPI0023DC8103|nr:histone-lysine N-methyltransferase SMYD3-like [Oppia nitens]